MQTYTTQKLFYRTFPFKVILAIPRSNRQRDVAAGSQELVDLRNFLEDHPSFETRTRVEAGTISVFFKDKNFLGEISTKFNDMLTEFYEPAEGTLDYFVANQSVEIRKTLIHGCRYKVILKAFGKNQKDFSGFVNLISNHPDQFFVGYNLKEYFLDNRKWYFGTAYFYVKEKQYLMMAYLSLSAYIKEVVTMKTVDEVTEKEQTDV